MGIEILVEGLAKSFGPQVVWQDVSLELPAGEISALMGPLYRAARQRDERARRPERPAVRCVGGVHRARPDQAQVLLFVNQHTTSTRISGSRVDLNRVRMTLRRAGHGWLGSNIEAL